MQSGKVIDELEKVRSDIIGINAKNTSVLQKANDIDPNSNLKIIKLII